MIEDNGELLIDLVAQDLLKQLEAVIYEKTFTQFGGIQVIKYEKNNMTNSLLFFLINFF